MLRCPRCGEAHFGDEACGRATERGLAYNVRLARGRAALAGVSVAAELEALALREAVPEPSGSRLEPVKRKGKGGRPPGLKPWKDRQREHRAAYMREYRARREAVK